LLDGPFRMYLGMTSCVSHHMIISAVVPAYSGSAVFHQFCYFMLTRLACAEVK